MNLDTKKKWLETIQSAITIGAIILGGVWSYMLFISQRERAPHAIVEVKTSVLKLTDEVNLIQVTLKFQNTGHVLIPVIDASARLATVLPLLGCALNDTCATRELNAALENQDRAADKFDWPVLADRDSNTPNPVEPGETTNLQFEFAIPAYVKVVRVYGFVKNDYTSERDKKREGWLDAQFVIIADAKSTECTKCKSDAPHT